MNMVIKVLYIHSDNNVLNFYSHEHNYYTNNYAYTHNTKPCTYTDIGSEEQLSAFLAESLIMKDFRHPHILGLVGVCFDAPDGSPYIVLPFMANGSVKTYLRQKRVHVLDVESMPEVRMHVKFENRLFLVLMITILTHNRS